MEREMANSLENLVRVGTVTWTDPRRREARVKFHDMGITSGPLHVLASRPYVPDYDTSPQRTQPEEGGSGELAFDRHTHELCIKPWLPQVGAIVLCLYLPGFNMDGYILGEIGALDEIKQ